MNQLRIEGKILELSALRYTPAGIPVVDFKIAHESEQDEAGRKREVKTELSAVAFEAQARMICKVPVGAAVRLEGFLGAKTKRSKRIVLHVTDIEFIES